MKTWLNKYWFFLGMAGAVILAFNFPRIGLLVKEKNILNVGVFLTFIFTGLTLPTNQLVSELRNVKGLSAALISCFVLFPLLVFGVGKVLFANNFEFQVGMCIMAVLPVTIASGIVLTSVAGGNVPLSLLITVSTNMAAIFTVPFSLSIFLGMGQEIHLPVAAMMKSLIVIVLVPTLIGQVLRIWLKDKISSYRKLFSFISQIVVLLVIFTGVASSSGRIQTMGAGIISFLLLSVGLHLVSLLMNWGICKTIKLNLPSTAAFTIHVSQKSLTIGYIVWSGYFMADYPLALIPAIGYHLTQLIIDTFVAHAFGNAIAKKQAALVTTD